VDFVFDAFFVRAFDRSFLFEPSRFLEVLFEFGEGLRLLRRDVMARSVQVVCFGSRSGRFRLVEAIYHP
jgi:hypothetical protein